MGEKSAKKLLVLLVDDQPAVGESLAGALRRCQGFRRVDSCPCGKDALSAVKRSPWHVAVLDACLHDPTAFELARRLVELRPTLRLLFYDDRLHVGHVREAVRLNSAGYHTKQESFPALVEAIRSVARGDLSYCDAVAGSLWLDGGRLRLAPEFDASPLGPLTDREREVFYLLAKGLTDAECAAQVGVAVKTIANHASGVMRKLAIHRRVDLMRFAIRAGLVSC